MAGNVKGITVEIGGDTTKLGKALTQSEKQSRTLQKELKSINTALKFNPGNIELVTQKQKVLAQQIQATKEKLDTLKAAEAQVEAQFNAGEIGEAQFREFQREIIETESKLKTYQQQLEATGQKASALDELTTAISEQESEVDRLKNEWKNAVLTYGEGSDEANKLADEIDSLSTELKENKDKMDALDRAADDLDNSLEEVDASAEKANDGFTVMKGALADLAARAITAAADALVDLGKKTLEVGMNFESAMSNNAALFGATGDELDKLSQTAQHYGETTQFSASEAAEALGYMALAGWDANKATEELGGVLDLAAASGMGLAESSDMVTDYLSAFSNTAMTATEFSDKLAYAQANSNTTAAQLGEAYKNSAANLNAAGQDMETVTSLLSAMANQGLKGAESGTALSAMMRDLTQKMKDGKVMIGETAVAVQDSEGNYRDLTDILKDVESATNGMGDAEKAAALSSTFTADSIKGLNLILNDGVDKAADFEEGLRNCDGAAANMAEVMNDNVAGSLKLLKSNIESKMIKVFEAAKGSIRSSVNTMSDALDSIDWDKVGEAVGRFAEKIAQLFTFLVDHADAVKGVLIALGATITSVFAINKIANFVNSLTSLGSSVVQVATKLGILKGATDAATASTRLLAIAQMALPWVALAAGVAAVVAALYIYNKRHEEAIRAENGLTKAQEETIKAVNRSKEAYDEMDKARNEAMSNISTEYGYLDDLKSEYNGLIDSNGEVKEGYEDRANFIINQLATALGVERSEIEKNIDANGQLGDSIDTIIQKKQAEATLAANEDAYTKAIQNRNTALKELTDAQDTFSQAESKYAETSRASKKVMDEYQELLRTQPQVASQYLMGNQDIITANDEAKKAYDKAKQAVEDAESTYVGYNATIQNYEGLSSAIISGDTDKIATALVNMQNNFVTAETGTKDSLEKQVKTFQDQYAAMKQAVDDGMPGITQSQVDAMADLVARSEEELNKLAPKAETSAKKAGDAHAKGLELTGDAAKTAAEKVAKKADAGLNSADTKKTGTKKGTDFGTGIKSTDEAAGTAGKNVSNKANSGMGSADTNATGKKKGDQFVSGVNDKQGSANTAGKNLGNKAKDGAGSISLTATGQKEGGQFVDGVNDKKKAAKTAGENLGSNAKSGAGSYSAYTPGANLGQGFIDGMGSKLRSVINKAAELARSAIDKIKSVIKQGSPSRVMIESGGFFGEGFVIGINDKIKSVTKAAQNMAKAALDPFDELETSPVFGDPNFNSATFGRQLDNTFSLKSTGPDLTEIIKKLDAVTAAIVNNSDKAIVLDTGVLVGETLNKIDNGLANTYALKARGV